LAPEEQDKQKLEIECTRSHNDSIILLLKKVHQSLAQDDEQYSYIEKK